MMSVTTPMFVSATLLLIGQVGQGDLDSRPWIALGGLWWLLSVVLGGLGNVAGIVAWLVAGGMIYLHGEPVINLVTGVTKKGGSA